tara:strand:+ start:547 stop:1110 length:564 start_codon:yes stop_codon:yes gene_type:complete
MQSPYSFLVKPVNDRRYDNVSKMGDVDFLISTSEEDHVASNRFAEVLNVPIGYTGEVKIGDTMLVHHNVFKFYNDMKGVQKSGKSFFKDNLFLIDPDQFFLYGRDGEWYGYDKYCFIKPSPVKAYMLNKSGQEEPLFGTIKYINKQLEDLGLKVGDEISYIPESEYAFNVDGEKLYRMYTSSIALKL